MLRGDLFAFTLDGVLSRSRWTELGGMSWRPAGRTEFRGGRRRGRGMVGAGEINGKGLGTLHTSWSCSLA